MQCVELSSSRYLLNIRRNPLEKIEDLIVVNGVGVSELLGEFVNSYKDENTQINKSFSPKYTPSSHVFNKANPS